ncbi:MAG: valyl-tRNA synthetase [Synergistaceae bacterium]|nr:valyl-tRNA synthetase [Synergistaceae bacterium]
MNAKRIALHKSYDPNPIEDKWYQHWLELGLFYADVDFSRKPFCIVIPPPNVTGSLHMGHALNNTLQDVVCRYKRMRGYNVLWLPGTDHAGIATQNVVERSLAKEGLSRQEIGREAFIKMVWEWKERYGSRIISQLKRLGASCDWRRERFTMDEGLSKAVRAVFVRLYEKGLIYKGKYIINWCPRCQTALSDLEVEYEPELGKLYFVAYPFLDDDETVIIATTRPETILGDVAVAVHPKDERYRAMVGRHVRVPLTGRIVPIIEDDMVDPDFGTGCVKITPAHDPNDFEVGLRHGLEPISVMDSRGVMNESAGSYAGLDRYEARQRAIKELEDAGLLIKVEDYEHSVGHCYRCHTAIEPFLSEQWFVRIKPLAEPAMRVVKEGQIEWIPEQWVNTYYQWLDNVRDWCISRQLWWGHRIPAWTCGDCGHITVSMEDPSSCEKCGSANIKQDEDVLDTWFSSALWPFSTLGWPDDTVELRYFYPTSLLVTGFDIIFFWVARMIMMGLEFMDDVPFRQVYVHALVRDEEGQKMSKSRGNVIDPLDVIAEYGADALRFTLCSLTVQGRDIFLSAQRIETYRFFLNKLWNACRLALINLGDCEGNGTSFSLPSSALRLHDRWILSKINHTIKEVTNFLEGYFFGEASRLLYDFTWGELCDWYLEMAKPALRGDEGEERRIASLEILLYVFRRLLLLLHPFIPFVTEELWHAFAFEGQSIEMVPWPQDMPVLDNPKATEDMALLQESIRAIRNLRAQSRFAPQKKAPRACFSFAPEARHVVEENVDLISLLASVEEIRFVEEKPHRSLTAVLPQGNIYLEVGGMIDVDAEIGRLEKLLVETCKEMERSERKLADENFLSKAPEEVVEKEKARLYEAASQKEWIERNLASLRS